MRRLAFRGKELWRVLGKDNKNLRKLERELGLRIEVSGSGDLTVKSLENDPIAEYNALRILDALALGFGTEIALQLEHEDYDLLKINVHNYAKGARVEAVKGIVIGTQGKTKKVIEELSECDIMISDHTIAVIGKNENAELASEAIKMLLNGAKQANVYTYLEKSRARLKDLEREDIESLIKKK